MGRSARVSVSRQQEVLKQVTIARDADDLGSSAGMQDSLGISAMMWEDGRIVCGMVVVGGGHVGEGAGDAVPRAGMVAPAPGVHEGEGEIAVDMVRVAAGLVDEGRDGMLLKVGAVHAGAEGVDEPGGEDRIHPLDFVTKVRGGITHAEEDALGVEETPPEPAGSVAKGARGGGRHWEACALSAAARSAGGRV